MSTYHISSKTALPDYRVELSTANHQLLADEGEAAGGHAAGPVPHEYLLAALAACTSITLRMYAGRKQWNLEQVDLDLTLERRDNQTYIQRSVSLTGTLTAEQRERLLAVADACPVHKLLTNPIHIETTLR